MSLHENILKNLIGHSKAMYSTWFYYSPTRMLFDAGEGLFLGMGNSVFGIDTVFISHGHHDHIGGLAGLVFARSAAMGDKEKPLTIYHPEGWASIDAMKAYVSAAARKYPLVWKVARPGMSITTDKSKNMVVKPFMVEHSKQGVCLGYALVESRNKLKPEFVGMSTDEIREAAKSGNVNESVLKTVLAYCGDSGPTNPDKVRGAEVLMHESSFLDETERRGKSHSTVSEAMDVAVMAGAKSLVLYHVSGRYNPHEVKSKVEEVALNKGFKLPLSVVVGRRIEKVFW